MRLTLGKKYSHGCLHHRTYWADPWYQSLRRPWGLGCSSFYCHNCRSSGISSQTRNHWCVFRQFQRACGNPEIYFSTRAPREEGRTHWFEGSNWRRLVIWRIVIDGHASSGILDVLVAQLRNALERPISSTEVKNGGPIIREILGKRASSARGLFRHVLASCHCNIECVLVLLGEMSV